MLMHKAKPDNSRYTLRMPAPAKARVRLVFLHHAGGSATAFFRWRSAMPRDWEALAIDLPGRRISYGESFVSTFDDAVNHVLQLLENERELPLIIFGHSMGSAVGFEVARILTESKQGHILAFVPSARMPAFAFAERKGLQLHQLPRAELLQHLQAMGGLPSQYLKHQDALDIVLDLVRHDLKIIESHHGARPASKVQFPILPVGGEDDHLASFETLQDWLQLTEEGYDTQLFPGGHFYMDQQYPYILRYLAAWMNTKRNYLV